MCFLRRYINKYCHLEHIIYLLNIVILSLELKKLNKIYEKLDFTCRMSFIFLISCNPLSYTLCTCIFIQSCSFLTYALLSMNLYPFSSFLFYAFQSATRACTCIGSHRKARHALRVVRPTSFLAWKRNGERGRRNENGSQGRNENSVEG